MPPNSYLQGENHRACIEIHTMPPTYPPPCLTSQYLHFRPVAPVEAPAYHWNCSWSDWSPPAQGDDLAISEMAVKHPPRALLSRDLSSWLIGGNKARPSTIGGSTFPPQWINADLSTFDLTVLGKFDVIVQDSAFDIHMSLPYGTMTDSAIRSMPLQHLQDTGLIFFWVTGRAMELGRELLSHWGYTRVDELVWVKVGQTQRLIRTGRTGHWMNHTKEHCLIGAKNASGVGGPIPEWAHRGLDSDVLVSEVRDTSRKPDELYAMIERLAPGGRKLELFGRKHNARSGWLTIGNQLKSDQIVSKRGLRSQFQSRYTSCSRPRPPSTRSIVRSRPSGAHYPRESCLGTRVFELQRTSCSPLPFALLLRV